MTSTTSPTRLRVNAERGCSKDAGLRRRRSSSWSARSCAAGASPSYDRNAEALERQAVADRLTAEQATLLQVTRLLNRVEIRGGAGSGKTVLALAQARSSPAGEPIASRSEWPCSATRSALAEFLKREVASWPRKHRPAFVGTYEELGARWGVEPGAPDDSDYWEHEFPRPMADAAAELAAGHRFDSFIVDESQDFADAWWTPLIRAMKDEETGGLYVYSDESQRVFARFGHPPVPLVPLVLDHNLRNTRQIHGCLRARSRRRG